MNTIALITSFVFGLLFGSFLNAIEYRSYSKKSLWKGRSICPKCRKQIFWYDNIPVFSFIILGAKCRRCRKKISLQYPLVELICGLLFLLVTWYHLNDSILLLARDLVITWILLYVFVYDFKYQLISDWTTLLPAGIYFFLAGFLGWNSWVEMLIGAGVGGGFFLVQFMVSKGKWIGGGDIRLGVLMGVILGWPVVLVALFFAYIVGALIATGLIICKKRELSSKVAFGTFLAAATWFAMFWGSDVLIWYLGTII